MALPRQRSGDLKKQGCISTFLAKEKKVAGPWFRLLGEADGLARGSLAVACKTWFDWMAKKSRKVSHQPLKYGGGG